MSRFIAFVEKDFVLSQAQRKASRILVFGSGKQAEGKLASYSKEQFVIALPAKQVERFKKLETVSIFLAHEGQTLVFESTVKKASGTELVIEPPEKLIKTPQRSAVRVAPPENLLLEFYLHNKKIRVECPESREYAELEMPAVNMGFDSESMKTLLGSFKALSENRFTKSALIMFDDKRKPESLEEKLISEFGRVLLIPSVQSPLPSHDPYPKGRIITQAMADDYEGPSIFVDGSLLERHKIEHGDAGIISELYCPVLYYQYVVGYIFIMNDDVKKECLDYKAVDFAWEFSRLLAYTLKTHNYYKIEGEAAADVYVPKLLDLSASGCLLAISKDALKLRLKFGASFDIALSRGEMKDGKMQLKGRVVRFFEDKENDYYGISFIKPDARTDEALRAVIYSGVAGRFSCEEASLGI